MQTAATILRIFAWTSTSAQAGSLLARKGESREEIVAKLTQLKQDDDASGRQKVAAHRAPEKKVANHRVGKPPLHRQQPPRHAPDDGKAAISIEVVEASSPITAPIPRGQFISAMRQSTHTFFTLR